MHDDDSISNPLNGAEPLGEIINRRVSRRRLLEGGLVASAAMVVPGVSGCATQAAPGDADSGPSFQFDEIARGLDETHHVPEGYVTDVLVKWGDALFPNSPAFDPLNQTAASQARQFGYNCDFVGFLPLPSDGDERGLLCVNHEFTSTTLMLPDIAAGFPASITADVCAVEMAAHGGTVVEIEQRQGRWQVNLESPFNRRVFGHGTPMTYTGPAAGSPRLATASDPTGRTGHGTLNNCAGGITPWGTYLMAEENFHGYFQGTLDEAQAESANHARYGVPGGWFQWGRFYDDFNIDSEPNGPNRYGWVVEVDVLDPNSKPKKRTAMGRFKHEGAESVIAPDGRVVIYMGDDERFEYVYKFVTDRAYDASNREANLDLLDNGTLYVGRFAENGRLDWLPMRFGEGPLTPENGFASQADVVIETRRAADLLGATPMDRPEDVEAQPDTGRAYVMLTNNHLRTPENTNAANPRPMNAFGHIVEIINPNGDHAAETARWEVLLLCGDPSNPEVGSTWNPATTSDGWFGSPDNCAFDAQGRMWVATDGNIGSADGVWAIETDGPLRGTGKAFFRAPVGAEVCGPRFTPDGKTLFVAVQHPGAGERATFEAPTTRWPDFDPEVPPRPSVVAIYREDGGQIG